MDYVQVEGEECLQQPRPSMMYTSPLADFSDREACASPDRRDKVTVGGKWPRQPFGSRKTEEEKPYSRPPADNRRKFLEDDPNLPPELKELFGPLTCKLCNCEMGSTVTARGHYKGKKHSVNIKKWFGDHPDLMEKYKIPDTNRSSSIDTEKLYCNYCDITLSSEPQAEAHYAGKKHQDMINGKMMKNAFFNTKIGQWERCETAREDKTGRFGIGLAFTKPAVADSPLELGGHRFFCDVCQVACPSQISLNDHLSGAKHKKKTAALSREVSLPGEGEEKGFGELLFQRKKSNSLFDENGRDGEVDLRCKICKKTLADVSSLVSHLRESKNHMNNLRRSEKSYSCTLCQKDFNGHDSMIDHLTGMSHEVMVAQNIFDYRFDRKMTETLDCSYCDFDALEVDDAVFHFLSEDHEQRLKSPLVAVDGTCIKGPSEENVFADRRGTDGEDVFRTRIAPKIIDASAFYFCSVCNLKIFGGKSHLLKHLKGFGHSAILRDPNFEMKIYLDYGMGDWKAAKDNILETVIKSEKKIASPTDLSIYRTPSGNYYCQPCDVTVNSQAQFLQHSESRKHKHKLSNKSK